MGCSTFFNFAKGGEGAARPTKKLWLLMFVYGALSTYGEMMVLLFNLLTVPLQKFYNGSIYEHYGTYLDGKGMDLVLSIIANQHIFGASLSVIFLLPKMDTWGRKNVALHVRSLLGCIVSLCYIGSKLMNSVELYVLGEFVLGLYTPLKMAVVKHYLSECAPTAYRGFITHSSTMLLIFVLLPITLLCNPSLFGNDDYWHYMGFVSLGLNLSSYIIGLQLPESPKFLYFKGKPKKQVANAIRTYQGKHVNINEIMDSYYKESELTNSVQYKLRDLWRDETLRNSFILVCLIVFGTTLTVSPILSRYEMILLLEFGFNQEKIVVLASILEIILLPLILFVPMLFEKLGRRPLLLIGTFLHIILPITIFAAKFLSDNNGPNVWSMALGLFSVFMSATSTLFGHSAIYLVLIADIIPEGAKVVVSQACLLISYLGPFPITFLYPMLVEHLSGFIFLPFSLIQLFVFAYLYQNLFETKQREVYKNVETMEEHVRSRQNSFFAPAGVIRRQRASTIHGYLSEIYEDEDSMIKPLLDGEPKRKYGRIERFSSLNSGIRDWA